MKRFLPWEGAAGGRPEGRRGGGRGAGAPADGRRPRRMGQGTGDRPGGTGGGWAHHVEAGGAIGGMSGAATAVTLHGEGEQMCLELRAQPTPTAGAAQAPGLARGNLLLGWLQSC